MYDIASSISNPTKHGAGNSVFIRDPLRGEDLILECSSATRPAGQGREGEQWEERAPVTLQ